MKVLFTFGGIPHYLNALLEKLYKKGVDIVVVTPQKGNATIGQGVKMVEGGTYRHLTTPEKKMFYGKSAFPALPDLISREKPDLVVMGWPYFLQLFFQPRLRRVLRACGTRVAIREIPFQTPPYGRIRSYFRQHPMYDENMCLQSHGTAFLLRQWLIARLRRYCYARCAGILCYSSVGHEIIPSYGVKPERIHVTYNATDTEALLSERQAVEAEPAFLPPCHRRLLHIGRLVKWKRVDLLIDAFAQLAEKYPDAELTIVGNGPELENLKQQARRLNLTVADKDTPSAPGCVRFTGAIYDPKELGACMHESLVYVLAGMGGLSINDAMTYGLPVVCSVCDGTERDLVADGRNGLFFRDGDVDSLTLTLDNLLASPERCRTMGQESERIIREQINLDTVAKRYLLAFNDLMKMKNEE